jgi:hypothetical protein
VVVENAQPSVEEQEVVVQNMDVEDESIYTSCNEQSESDKVSILVEVPMTVVTKKKVVLAAKKKVNLLKKSKKSSEIGAVLDATDTDMATTADTDMAITADTENVTRVDTSKKKVRERDM